MTDHRTPEYHSGFLYYRDSGFGSPVAEVISGSGEEDDV